LKSITQRVDIMDRL